MSSEDDSIDVEVTINDYCNRLLVEFKERIASWKTDFSQSVVHEVVGCLLSRQITLARSMAICPHNWNEHIAPLYLRAMADVHIALAWILGDPRNRSTKFVLYGLGQQKLELEHRKTEMQSRKPFDGEADTIDKVEKWIEEQRLTMLTEVNLGSWSGLTTRAMAEEANCLDFYNYVYSPFSACVHSMWHHIARYNAISCKNPLHRYHRVPDVVELEPTLHYLYLAAKYAQKSLAAFDEAFLVQIKSESAFEKLCEALE